MVKHPGLTLALTISYLIWLGMLPEGDWIHLGRFALLLWIGATMARRNSLALAVRSLAVTPFGLAALPLILTVPGPSCGTLLGHPLSLAGCQRFLTILMRAWLGAQAGLLCISLLGRQRLLLALSQLGLPPLLLSIITLMLRYLQLLHEELARTNRAREARSAGSKRPSWWWRARKIGQTAGSLLVRSLDRGDRVYLAMKSRGYDGRERRLNPVPRARGQEWLSFFAAQLGMWALTC